MDKSIIISESVKAYFSSHASLAAIGRKVKKLKVFEPIEQKVKIAQKMVKYSPSEKLLDGFITLLSGAQGMVEVNKRLKADTGLQRAFGRTGCAEQSVVQDTLDACTAENVTQMHQAMEVIFRRNSQTYRHDYQLNWQVLDTDMTGRPCGRKAKFASKGYFAKQRNRRGRQEGYVIGTWYEEIVVERIFDGKTQLNKALRPLIEASEQVLEMDERKRQRTILRIDSGGGSVEDINWMLERGYQVQAKDYSGVRAKTLAESVTDWVTDPCDSGRQIGWVTVETDLYCRPVKRIAVRCHKKNGHWGYGLIISTLAPKDVLLLTGGYEQEVDDPTAVLLAYVNFYDERGGGVEIEIKEDKQGLGTTKRNKRRFEAQQVLVQLEVLAHNVLIWARKWLASHCPKIARLGIKRLVRDVFQMDGYLVFDQTLDLLQVMLNRADPLANELSVGLAPLLAREQVAITLGET
ncbi:MAG: transposase [Chloroflexota bacterium]|nr:MAG: transposase [Chloroflexota bacterium]